MEQQIRFLPVDGRRLAFSVVGDGPPLVIPAWWVSHLELNWEDDEFRAYVQALARSHAVIRYDRIGVGLSDRDLDPAELTVERDVETLVRLLDHLGNDRCNIAASSSGGCIGVAFAAAHPHRVSQLILYGAYPNGSGIADQGTREAILAVVRAHWGLGARLLADVFLPGSDEETRERFASFQRACASAGTAVELLAYAYGVDVRARLGAVRSPTLVIHRREDRAVPYELGRELASDIPDARLVTLRGRDHFPWRGNAAAVIQATTSFLGSPRQADRRPVISSPRDHSPLTDREIEVVRLIARGLADREIAEQLVVSPHTVHRHVANIRRKLLVSSRAAAVAEAVRLGLIEE